MKNFVRCIFYGICFVLPFSGIAQDEGLPASISYHILGDYQIQELPAPNWLIKEGEDFLSPEGLRVGDFKDAQVLDLKQLETVSSEEKASYWIKINLSSAFAAEELKMLVEPRKSTEPYDVDKAISRLTAYYFKNDALISTGFTGRDMPSSKRDIKDFYYQSVLLFDLPEKDTLEIWLNFVAPPGNVTADLKIYSSNYEFKHASWPLQSNTFFYYIGTLTTLLVICPFLLIWFKEKIYVWFLVFLLINVFTLLVWKHQTTFINLITPEQPRFGQIIGYILDSFKWTFLLLFGRVFIDTKRYFPRVDKVFLISTILFFIVGVPIMLHSGDDPNMRNLPSSIMIILALMLLSIIGILVYFILSKNKLARFYSIGTIIPFVGMFIIGLFRDIIWARTMAEVLMNIGPILTMALAVAYRFRLEGQGRIAAEQEKRSLLENQTILLEKQVSVRTEELSQSLENLKSTQTQLIQSEKMASLGELTAGIAHEIQNPLNFVNNFSDVSSEMIDEVQEELTSTPLSELTEENIEEAKGILIDLKSNLEKISHHGNRASSIVKGMLDHSRADTGEKVPTDINALCDEYLRLSYHGLRAKDKSFNSGYETHFDDQIPLISVVPQDIGRVLLNIINNAFYAVNVRLNVLSADSPLGAGGEQGKVDASSPNVPYPKGSHAPDATYSPLVTITTQRLHNSTTITIKDNGIGMSQETMDKVFQPFFTTKPSGQGTGLGMSIGYDIITKGHGGKLRVESEEGKGTIFTIEL